MRLIVVNRILAGFVLLALFAPASASGAVLTRIVGGTLSCAVNCSSPNASLNTFLNGKTFSGSYTYDDSVVPTSGAPSKFRDYGSGFNVSLNVGNGLYTLSVINAGIEILRNQNFTGEDRIIMFNVGSPVFGGSGMATFQPVLASGFESPILYEHLGAGNVLPDTLIASWPQTIATWSGGFAGVVFYITDGSNVVGYRGAFTTLIAAPKKNDLSGDGKADILWRNTSGAVAIWLMNGLTVAGNAVLPPVANSWAVAGMGDANGDGEVDIFWRNTSGDVAIWLMNGLTVAGSAVIGNVSPSWTIARIGDFNGNGKADILWRNSSGAVAIWLMNGLTIAGTGVLPSVALSWTIAAVGDFNGDAKDDILWRNASGDVAIWLINGLTVAGSGVLPSVATSWTIAGVGDFNNDAMADIVWRNTSSGAVAIWLMNGLAVAGSSVVANVATSWSIVGIADFNLDGKADILWRHTSGDASIWLMNGFAVSASGVLGNVATSWTVQVAGAP